MCWVTKIVTLLLQVSTMDLENFMLNQHNIHHIHILHPQGLRYKSLDTEVGVACSFVG